MFHTLDCFDSEFSADSIEWCPLENFQDIFVCGTYQLEENESDQSKRRVGRLYILKIVEQGKLTVLQRLDTAAVLDAKWHIVDGCVLLGVVNSDGYLQIYKLQEESLKFLDEITVDSENEDTLALSLDWSRDSSKDQITVSDSKGTISLFCITKGGKIEKISAWPAHEFEAWITAFDYWNPNVIYTGGDDCKFLCFDSRTPTETKIINHSHSAGVTSLHSNAKKEFILASGSYDQNLRLWDTRNLRRPTSETNLEGGIWRLKWDPFHYTHLLAACMYNGFRIVDAENPVSPKIVENYQEHKSISYGCDWSFLNCETIINQKLSSIDNCCIVGTCSFYDHAVKVSAVELGVDKCNT